MSRSLVKCLAVAGLAVAAASPAAAQASAASINASVTVLEVLNVTGVRDLAFGQIQRGGTRTIDALADVAAAGVFSVTASAPVTVAWTLPVQTAAAVPVTFGNWTFAEANDAAGTGATTFTLTGVNSTHNLTTAVTQRFLFVGGQATVPANATLGLQSAVIQVNVAYN